MSTTIVPAVVLLCVANYMSGATPPVSTTLTHLPQRTQSSKPDLRELVQHLEDRLVQLSEEVHINTVGVHYYTFQPTPPVFYLL